MYVKGNIPLEQILPTYEIVNGNFAYKKEGDETDHQVGVLGA